MADQTGAFTTLDAQAITKDGGTETITLTRLRDGGVKFVALNGITKILRDPVVTDLFDAIVALDS